MDLAELQIKLDSLGIDPSIYSLEGELKPDSIILYNSYQNWEVFYLDERGSRHIEGVFPSMEEACGYIYKIFKDYEERKRRYLK